MKTPIRILTTLFTFFSMACIGQAVEKDGVILNVSKNKLVYRKAAEGSDKMRKAEGLGITLRNNTIRTFAEGEVKWTIAMRKYDPKSESSSKYSYWYISTGTEVLKPMRGSEAVEMFLSEIHAGGRDEVEYEVIVTHGDSETIRITTEQNFDALAKKAVNYSLVMGAAKLRAKPAEGAGKPLGEGGRPAALAGNEKPGDPTAMPPKEGAQPSKDTPAIGQNANPTESDPALSPAKPFDFFNLANTKKKPVGE